VDAGKTFLSSFVRMGKLSLFDTAFANEAFKHSFEHKS
jgi:hypothetical protein